MKRRDAIKTMGALAGSAGLPKLLAGCDGKDITDQRPGIDTWVFVMMENRSYDHYLGARALEGKPGDGLRANMSNPDRNGDDVAVFRSPDGEAMCVMDPPHSWNASRTQLNGGANDGFLIAHQGNNSNDVAPMSYMTRDQVSTHNALADAYTVCDRWFSSVLGPTLPNRMYWHAGTSNGATNNDDIIGGAYEGVPSLYHRLDEAGVDWAYYFGDVPVLSVLDIPTEGRVKRFMYDFIDDAAAGKLPPVVYIDPGFGINDDHPPHHPLLGQQLLSAVYTALATSPQWNNCMLLITYDEHGGFFDHVPPPAGVADDFAAQGFDQLGFRVPTVVAGPYAKQSHVSSVEYNHASCLKHLQDEFGLSPLTARVSASNNLMDCIDLERLAAGDPAPPLASLPAVEIDDTMLPDACKGGSVISRPYGPYDHDILAWADAKKNVLGDLDRRHESRDYVYFIADYLDQHGRGRIRRGR